MEWSDYGEEMRVVWGWGVKLECAVVAGGVRISARFGCGAEWDGMGMGIGMEGGGMQVLGRYGIGGDCDER